MIHAMLWRNGKPVFPHPKRMEREGQVLALLSFINGGVDIHIDKREKSMMVLSDGEYLMVAN